MPHRFNVFTPENWLRPASRWERLPHRLPPPPPGAAFRPSTRHRCFAGRLTLQAVVAGVGDADYINRQLMEILAPKTDYMAVRGAQGKGAACAPHAREAPCCSVACCAMDAAACMECMW